MEDMFCYVCGLVDVFEFVIFICVIVVKLVVGVLGFLDKNFFMFVSVLFL